MIATLVGTPDPDESSTTPLTSSTTPLTWFDGWSSATDTVVRAGIWPSATGVTVRAGIWPSATGVTALAALVRHLADRGYNTRTLVDAVERPWDFDTDYQACVAIRVHEADHPGHTCRDGGGAWYCDTSTATECPWRHGGEAS